MAETIHDHLVRLVVPFDFNSSFAEAHSVVENSGIWKANNSSPKDLFLHIKNLISGESPIETIGRQYMLESDAQSAEGIPIKTDTVVELRKKNPEGPDSEDFFIDFTIPAIHLYLFETRVGFFAVDVRYREPQSLCAIARGNFYLKKIGVEIFGCTYSYSDPADNSAIVESEFPITSFIRKTASGFGDFSFFERENNLPRHCLIFCYLILDKVEKNAEKRTRFINESLFRLSKGGHCNYFPPLDKIDSDNNPAILNFVDNIYWGVTLEGCTNISYFTHDGSPDHFLQKIFPERIQESYFYLYILALVQRFSLLILAQKTARIPLNVGQSIKELSADHVALDKIRQLQQDIPFYGLRINFSQVAHSSHYTLFYEKLKDVYRVDHLFSELDTEVKNLGAVIDQFEALVKSEKEEKQKNIELWIAMAAIVFAIASVLSDGLGFLSFMNWFDEKCPVTSLGWVLGSVALLLIIARLILKKTVFFSGKNDK